MDFLNASTAIELTEYAPRLIFVSVRARFPVATANWNNLFKKGPVLCFENASSYASLT